jgi:hypothetical protein
MMLFKIAVTLVSDWLGLVISLSHIFAQSLKEFNFA